MRFVRLIGAFVLAAALVSPSGLAATLAAQAPAPIFRVFLKDGTALACWGEYATVGDTLVLTIPVGSGARRTYEFLTLPVARVDLARTERYAEAVRAAQFAKTRGAAEYRELRDRLAKQLAAIPLLPDAGERLAAAESVRQQLLDWANQSHGYRAQEVHQLLQLFDSTIIDLRVAAGESRFSINLTAGVAPPPPPRLRADPGAAETVALALRAASATDDEEVRKTILRRARSAAAGLGGDVGTALRSAVADRVAAEARVDARYRWLASDVTRLAASAADRGDAPAIDALRQRVARTDRAWGRKRPSQVVTALAALDVYFEAAAERRLVLDQWEAVRKDLVAYKTQVAPLVLALDRLRPMLTAIADLAGTPMTDLVRGQADTAEMVTSYSSLHAPAGAADAHGLLAKAIERADFAVRARYRAVATQQVAVAREAAEAAKDARATLANLKTALGGLLRPPQAASASAPKIGR
ncbi:MAG: hypothetical protein EPO35_04390 [Acidobacteria bacterium]|nr:MAG: hypothetical protein EPO35_04390 [Acidobacteriota bacterium]